MIHRDRIIVRRDSCRRVVAPESPDGEGSGADEPEIVYGTVVTEQTVGKLEPFGTRLIAENFYRLVLPADFDTSGNVQLGWRGWWTQRGSAITPIMVGGRVHHYEAIVKAP